MHGGTRCPPTAFSSPTAECQWTLLCEQYEWEASKHPVCGFSCAPQWVEPEIHTFQTRHRHENLPLPLTLNFFWVSGYPVSVARSVGAFGKSGRYSPVRPLGKIFSSDIAAFTSLLINHVHINNSQATH